MHTSLRAAIEDLESVGEIIRISEEVDPYLEMAEIRRRIYKSGGPALLFENVKGSPFAAVSNLYGSMSRSRYLFRKSLPRVKKAFELKSNPKKFFKNPFKYTELAKLGIDALPQRVVSGPCLECETTLDQLPQIHSWKDDGGAFVLLPQVFTSDPYHRSVYKSNMGMYRIQISGNDYIQNEEIGLHYQIRRDIGIHHQKAIEKGEPLKVSIFVGGPPAHAFAAVMYLPEHLPEIAFAGALAGRRFRYARRNGYVISADADFCITGTVDPRYLKPEGPFGDHLGYYSLKHDYPYMRVEKVYHRKDAIWPFTIVGRPPQEDTSFGHLIQEIAGPVIQDEIPGVHAVHAVDAAGVHPLLLAVGSERYQPYKERKPEELLTLANSLLGYGPLSLAKYLLIVAKEDQPDLNIKNVSAFFTHLLERVDWKKDIHFQTQTTMDTLDYSSPTLNKGSKVVIAAAGDAIRVLSTEIPDGAQQSKYIHDCQFFIPGILVLQIEGYADETREEKRLEKLCSDLNRFSNWEGVPLIVLADDASFATEKENNFLWTLFTRSDPASDIYGVRSSYRKKHWGCEGPLVIDARIKPHHAPVVEVDVETKARVDSFLDQCEPLKNLLSKTVIDSGAITV